MIKLLLLITVISFQTLSSSATELNPITQIQKLIEDTGEDLNVGIEFRNINSNTTLYSLHSKRKFIPASTTKLFTAYIALHQLKENFQYKTALLHDDSGNTYIRFSGDPPLTYQDLENILSHVKNKNIKGNIVLDGSIFDDKPSSRGGFTWDDTPFYYAAPTSAIIINDNCSQAVMEPNKKIGQKARLEIDDTEILHIKNSVSTVSPNKIECPYKSKYLGNNTYEVYGCMFSNLEKPIKLNFALPDNNLMAKDYLNKAIKRLGISLSGKIVFGNVPKNAKILYEHKSAPLKDLLVQTMHDSHNLTFASLFKYVAHKNTGLEGSDENCEIVLRDFLHNHGIDKSCFNIKDGSGDSKYNLVSPKGIVDLLQKAYNSDIRQSFVKTLPQYGSKSTLRNRSIDNNFLPYIYAKTGSLKGTSSLAGYYLPKKQKGNYAFAIMINNHTLLPHKAKELEDQILQILLTSIN